MNRTEYERDDRVPYARDRLRLSRRTLLHRSIAATGAALLTVADGHRMARGAPVAGTPQSATLPHSFPSHQPFHAAKTNDQVLVFPRPGSRTASPHTQITFRNISIDHLGSVKATGTNSGGHTGVLLPHSDGNGASFLPDAPFRPAESVTVHAGLNIRGAGVGSVIFTVAQPVPSGTPPTGRDSTHPKRPPRTFRSRPDLLPPAMTITTPAVATAPGHIFLGAKVPDGQNGAMILDEKGELVWFDPLPLDIASIDDVRVQQYHGQPVLTWWQGTGPRGYGLGHYIMRNASYHQIATIRVGNGHSGGDLHEFLITPQGTVLVSVYSPVRWDLTSAGGSNIGTAIDGIVQEIDIPTGLVLFEWHSLEHIDVDESYGEVSRNPADPFDYFHLNSIDALDDDALLVSGRHTWGIYKIDRRTGDVIWRLNGKRSDFKMGPGSQVAYQHDARMHDNGELSVFDNHASTRGEADQSRGVVLKLDAEAMTATLAREYIHPTHILSISQGNLQLLPNGNAFIGWGSAPVLSEFSPEGDLVFNERFPIGAMSYRAFRAHWTGHPDDRPAIAAIAEEANMASVYVSWNGATDVVGWQILAGPDPDHLSPVHSGPKAGFESSITVQTAERYIAARAVDAAGTVLGTSATVRVQAAT